MGGRSTITNCYFGGTLSLEDGYTLINCVSKRGFTLDNHVTLIDCVQLEDPFDEPRPTTRLIGCRDVNGYYDDTVPNHGIEPDNFKLSGNAITTSYYQWMAQYGDSTFYDASLDTITAITYYDNETSVTEYTQQSPDVLDFSVAKTYNTGVLTQDGVTNDTIVTLPYGGSPIHSINDTGLLMVLYVNKVYSANYTVAYNQWGSFKILNSWSALMGNLDVNGNLNSEYDLFFPYVKIDLGVSSSGYAWHVQTQKKKTGEGRLPYWTPA